MELKFALLADHVTVTADGKLVLIGDFDILRSAREPVRYGPLFLVARFEARVSEGSQHMLRIGLFDEDGRPTMPMSPDLAVPFTPTGPGYPLRGQVIIHFPVVEFPRFGDYEFHILLDGRLEARVPVRVVRIQPKSHVQA